MIAVTLDRPRSLLSSLLELSRLIGPRVLVNFLERLLEAEFSSVNFEGFYTLSIEFGTSNGMHAFRRAPFEIRSRLVTSRMMKPLSILNAEARRAADEELLAQLDQRVRGLERRARRRISGRSR